MPRSFQPIIELDVIIPLRVKQSIKQQFIKFKPELNIIKSSLTLIEANVDPELLNTSDKWALLDEVIAYYIAANLKYLKGLIIHKCVDGKCSNNIYYNKRMKESLQ